MFCIKCGKELPTTAKFCPVCGTKTDDLPARNWLQALARTSTGKNVYVATGVVTILLIIILAVVGHGYSSKGKRYAERLEAYITYCETMIDKPAYIGYDVGGTILTDKDGMPVMWLFLVKKTDNYDFSDTKKEANGYVQFLTYERGHEVLLDEIRVQNVCLRPVPSVQGIGLNGGDCAFFFDEKKKKIRQINSVKNNTYNKKEMKEYVNTLAAYYEICSPYKPVYYFRTGDNSKCVYVGKSIGSGKIWKERWIPDELLEADGDKYKVTKAYRNNKQVKRFLSAMWMSEKKGSYTIYGDAVFDEKGKRIAQTKSLSVNGQFFFGELGDGESYVNISDVGFLKRSDFIDYMRELENNPAYTPQDLYATWMQ